MTSEVKYFEDISPEEESVLPLPGDWMRTIKTREDGLKVRVYQNVKTGQELEEHPIIARALNVARKLPLPLGWCMMETKAEGHGQGHVERFYYNADLQLSLWDPPLLRTCLVDYLKVLGFEPDSIGFRVDVNPPSKYDGVEERKSPLLSTQERGASLLNQMDDPRMSLTDLDHEHNIDHRHEQVRIKDNNIQEELLNNHEEVTIAYPPPDEAPPSQQSPLQHAPPSRDWEGLLNIYKQPILPFSEKISHRANIVQPPMTYAGVKILRADVSEANERTHHLLARIRSMLASKRGLNCTFLYHDSEVEGIENTKSVVTLASDIVTTLRQQPELVVMAITTNNATIGSAAMLQAAFVALHRLLHPFSTDYSMTTALLLQSINAQLEELSSVEQIFCHMDSKMIIPRALTIYDPVMAVQWNPLSCPLPMVPNVQTETVFSCLMRVYSIRRDVTAFFRAVWKPVLPAIALLLQSNESPSNPVVLENLVSLAYRLLENTFNEKSMTVFPITATAVCRAVHEIGGQEAMITSIYNFFILPNLVKILGGDHDSLENEDVYRIETASQVINRYFDYGWWLNDDTKLSAKLYRSDSERSLVILKSFLWTIWRVFSCSMYLNESAIMAYTVPEFIQSRLSFLNCTGIKDHKLRNLLARTQRKISQGCNWLIRMPLDINGNNFLGVEQDLEFDGLTMNHETHELLDRRLSSLSFKPGEMLNATVVSKYELCGFLSDVGCAMDAHEFPTDSPIYRAIADFLAVYGNFNNQGQSNKDDEEHNEEFITLSFLYTHHEDNDRESGFDGPMMTSDGSIVNISHENMIQEYKQLLRGLKLTNRYEDTLLNHIRKVDQSVVSNIFELLSASSAQWYLEPEFDTDFKVNHIEIAEKHTNESKSKVRNSFHGVKQSRPVNVFQLFPQHGNGEPPNNKGLKELQKDFFQSFRFGSAQKNVDVGTSLARGKVLPPKVNRGQVRVTTLPQHQVNSNYAASEASSRTSARVPYRSHYTEATIKADSSILVPTRSFLNMKNTLPVTPMDLDNNFMKSMRDHQVISTEEFQMRYFRRRTARSTVNKVVGSQSKNVPRTRDRKMESIAASIAKPPPAPKPFPLHLRHLIRNDDNQADVDQPTEPEVAEVSAEPWRFDSTYFRSLIHDYQTTIQPITSNHDTATSVQQHQSRNNERARSPGLPIPLDNSRIWSPTKSYVQKHQSDDISNEYLRDLADGKPPELRRYYHEKPAVVHEEPFSPTKSKLYDSTGPRARRVPEFLQGSGDSIYATSVSNSRDSTPVSRRGRSRSRSSSPATRSRSGSYAKPTFASVQQLSDRAYVVRGESRPDHFVEEEVPSPRSSLSSSPTRNDSKRSIQSVRKDFEPIYSEPIHQHQATNDSQYPPENAIPAATFLQNMAESHEQPTQHSEEELSQTRLQEEKKVNNVTNQSEAERQVPPPNTEVTGIKIIKKKIKLNQKHPDPVHTVSAPQHQLTPPAQSRRQFVIPPPQSCIGNAHKQTFAEAIASVVFEAAAASNTNGPPDSTYSLSFSPDVDHDRATVNLKEDRDRAMQFRRELLQRQDDDIEETDTGKYIENKDNGGRTRPVQDNNMQNREPESSGGGNRIPIMKKKSLIKNISSNKEMFLSGFYAKKHGRSGQPKMKKVLYDENKKLIVWFDAKRASITSIFASKEKEPSSLSILEVVDVKRGIHTDVFIKAGLLDPNLCLSLVTIDRTLDLVFNSKSERDDAFRGLRAITLSEGIDVNFV